MSLTGKDKTYLGNGAYPWVTGIVATFSTWQIPNDTIITLTKFIDSVDSALGRIVFTDKHDDIRGSATDSTYTGEMHITRFDIYNYIISGTFWFDAPNPYTGEIMHIRDGRFDVHFSD